MPFWTKRDIQQESNQPSLPSPRILCLKGPGTDTAVYANIPPIEVLGYQAKRPGQKTEESTVFIPTLTRDGHVSLIIGGSPMDFAELQRDVLFRFSKQIQAKLPVANMSLANFLLIGFTSTTAEEFKQGIVFLGYEALFLFPPPDFTLIEVYRQLGSGDIQEATKYFNEPSRIEWINTFLASVESILDWPNFVHKALKKCR